MSLPWSSAHYEKRIRIDLPPADKFPTDKKTLTTHGLPLTLFSVYSENDSSQVMVLSASFTQTPKQKNSFFPSVVKKYLPRIFTDYPRCPDSPEAGLPLVGFP